MIFYIYENDPYILINTAFGYSESLLKSSCFCDNIMFVYYGFDDAIAKNYLNFIEREPYLDLHLNDINIDYSGYDPIYPAKYYKIIKKEFIQINPDDHFQNLYNIMLNNEFILPLPPPPTN